MRNRQPWQIVASSQLLFCQTAPTIFFPTIRSNNKSGSSSHTRYQQPNRQPTTRQSDQFIINAAAHQANICRNQHLSNHYYRHHRPSSQPLFIDCNRAISNARHLIAQSPIAIAHSRRQSAVGNFAWQLAWPPLATSRCHQIYYSFYFASIHCFRPLRPCQPGQAQAFRLPLLIIIIIITIFNYYYWQQQQQQAPTGFGSIWTVKSTTMDNNNNSTKDIAVIAAVYCKFILQLFYCNLRYIIFNIFLIIF